MRTSEIKTTAKHLIANTKGSYALYAVSIMLLYASLLPNFAPSKTSITFNIMSLLISILTLLFTLSANFTMLLVTRQQKQTVQFWDNQLAFSKIYIWRLIRIHILKGIFLALLLGISFLGVSIIYLGKYLLTIDTISYYPIGFILLGSVISLWGFATVIRYYFAYRMSAYIAFDMINRDSDHYPSTLTIIKKSITLMKGYKWKLFLLDLSFIVWYLIVLMTFGLAYIYLFPYINVSEIIFYEKLDSH
ncbi:DUF975 family protein [Streptococcus sciuri]|uniref:DUF975 family protein n=1 Tax=Streptococcus sciuri TaxID=2973939 RepID=A0ABT2F7P7_9STRE|nr:DUF975 family protein [Streptococcus sciuri]MCS4488515.1 DUF975 family protein [Streptococcus sciuri]